LLIQWANAQRLFWHKAYGDYPVVM
jgi:hypothetical protein